MEDAGEAGGQGGHVPEIPRERPDAFDPLEPPEPRGIADEGVDLGPGRFEEPLDEMAPEEARSSGDQDVHVRDCMGFGRGGQ